MLVALAMVGCWGFLSLGVRAQVASLGAGRQLAPLDVEGRFALSPSEVYQGDQTSGSLVGWSGELVW